MQKHSDEALVAYLDGELDGDERAHVEAWLAADPAVRDRLLALAESATTLRSAFAEFVAEPVPERLIAAARGETAAATEAEIVVLRPRRASLPAAAVAALVYPARHGGRSVRPHRRCRRRLSRQRHAGAGESSGRSPGPDRGGEQLAR